jgi:hypothetical protein
MAVTGTDSDVMNRAMQAGSRRIRSWSEDTELSFSFSTISRMRRRREASA